MPQNNIAPRAMRTLGDSLRLLDVLEESIHDSLTRMVRSLPKQPHRTDWRQLGHSNRPARRLGRMMLHAYAAGADYADLELPAHALLQFSRTYLRPDDGSCVRTLSVMEQRSDFKVDMRQTTLTGNETVDELTAWELDIAEQMARLDALRRGIGMQKRRLQQDQRTRALLVRSARERVSVGA